MRHGRAKHLVQSHQVVSGTFRFRQSGTVVCAINIFSILLLHSVSQRQSPDPHGLELIKSFHCSCHLTSLASFSNIAPPYSFNPGTWLCRLPSERAWSLQVSAPLANPPLCPPHLPRPCFQHSVYDDPPLISQSNITASIKVAEILGPISYSSFQPKLQIFKSIMTIWHIKSLVFLSPFITQKLCKVLNHVFFIFGPSDFDK